MKEIPPEINIINGNNPQNSEFVSSEFLRINNCGFREGTRSPTVEIHRPNGRADYQIIYIERGVGYFTREGTEIPVPAGHLVVYLPGVPQIYTYRPSEPCDQCWIHFTGSGAETLLRQCDLWDGFVYEVGALPNFRQQVLRMQQEIQLKKPHYNIVCGALLEELLVQIARYRTERPSLPQQKLQAQFRKIIEEWNTDCTREVCIEEYARRCYLSSGYFIHRFREYTGLSPLAYRTRIRMEKAAELLVLTHWSIAEVAETVGYTNPMYFSRLFRKYMGCTPSTYKQENQ